MIELRNIFLNAVIVIFISLEVNCAIDPCQSDTYKLLLKPESRSTGYVLKRDQIACCDNRLDEGWYRVNSTAGEDMPTFCPPLYSCGTLYPIWLKGSIPPNDNVIYNRTVAIRYDSDCSFVSFTVQVKNCGEYRVYYLLELSFCTSGYCFGSKNIEVDTWCTPEKVEDTSTSSLPLHTSTTVLASTPDSTANPPSVVWIVIISLLSVILVIVAVSLVCILKKHRHSVTKPEISSPAEQERHLPPPYSAPAMEKHCTPAWQQDTSAPEMLSEHVYEAV